MRMLKRMGFVGKDAGKSMKPSSAWSKGGPHEVVGLADPGRGVHCGGDLRRWRSIDQKDRTMVA